MKVECIPLTSFVHGPIDAHEGKAVMIEERLADDLERAGLVRVKRARPAVVTSSAGAADAGKPAAAGAEQPSSASPAAQASPTTTAPPSGRGGKRAKKGA